MASSTLPLTRKDLDEAAARIAPFAHRTPVMTCAALDRLAGRQLFFKCENFQKVGAFKFRGACNAVMKLGQDECQRGVVTHSSGNHAQALALAAALRGVEAHIVMPSNVSPVKRRAVAEYGAQIYLCEPTLESRESTTADLQQETGATFIPPYDHRDIIAGQGTATLELLEQVADLDAVICPVGGGGLLAGTCIAVSGSTPTVRIFAGEPTGADDAARSMTAGRHLPQTSPRTIADGLLTSLGELNWPIIHRMVERIVTVSDDQTVAAMRLVWERSKLMIEPSTAVAVAAVLTDEFKALNDLNRIGVILSGGNVDLDRLPW